MFSPFPLEVIQIASPCKADWNSMSGDDRARHCGDCNLTVYNFSEMTRAEAEELVRNREGRLCARFYRRPDGTILTADCPVAWWDVRVRVVRVAAIAASLLLLLIGGLYSRLMGQDAASALPNPFAKLAVDLNPPELMPMGDICIAPPPGANPPLPTPPAPSP